MTHEAPAAFTLEVELCYRGDQATTYCCVQTAAPLLHLSFKLTGYHSHDTPVIDRQSNNTRSKNNFTPSILDLMERAVRLVKSYCYHIKMDFSFGSIAVETFELKWP